MNNNYYGQQPGYAPPPQQQQQQQPPVSTSHLQDIQAKMMMQNYARQQQMQSMQNVAMRAVGAPGPGQQQTQSPQPAAQQQLLMQSGSRPPSAAGGGGPMVNGAASAAQQSVGSGSRTTSASPFVQPRHISQTSPSPHMPSQTSPNGPIPPDSYGAYVNNHVQHQGQGGQQQQQQQRVPSAMGNHQQNGSMNGSIPMNAMQQQQQLMLMQQAHALNNRGTILPSGGNFDPRAQAQAMMGGAPPPNQPMANGSIQLRHPHQLAQQQQQQLQQQQQQQQQGGVNIAQMRRGPSMPPPGGSSTDSPVVRSSSTVPSLPPSNPQHHQQPPSLHHSTSSSSLSGDMFAQQQQMQNGGVPPRGSVPDVAFLQQQQQLRAAAAALANGGQQQQPMQMPMNPMQMQMMNGRGPAVGGGGGGVNGIVPTANPMLASQQPGMDPATALALQNLGSGLDHRGQPQQQQQQQIQVPGVMGGNKMMPPPSSMPSSSSATPRIGSNAQPFPHQQQQQQQNAGQHPQQMMMMPGQQGQQQGALPGQMLPPQPPHGGAFPGSGAPVAPVRPGLAHGPGSSSSSIPGLAPHAIHAGQHHPGAGAMVVPGVGVGVGVGAGQHAGFSSTHTVPPHASAAAASLAPLAPASSLHGLLHQLDQVRVIQRQHEVQLRQEHAHIYAGATGTTREYAAVLRDIVGTANPKYPPPGGLEDHETALAFQMQKGKMKAILDKTSDRADTALALASAYADRQDKLGSKMDEDEEAKPKVIPPPAEIAKTLEELYPPLKDLHQGTTRIRVLPRPTSAEDVTHGGALPVLSESDITHLKNVIMPRDEAYEAEWREARARMDEEVRVDVGGVAKWWERDLSVPMSVEEAQAQQRRRTRLEVVWPQDGRAAREKRKKKQEIKLPRPSRAAARKPEELIPIRIDIEQESHRLRETFVWNINDSVVTPEMFAQLTCEDLELPASFKSAFVLQVKTQIAEYTNHRSEYPATVEAGKSAAPDSTGPRHGALSKNDEAWWARWRKRIRIDDEGGAAGASASNQAQDARDMPPPSLLTSPSRKRKFLSSDAPPAKVVQIVVDDDDDERNHEMRVVIKLDITVGSVQLTDQFEWDVSDLDASPERFAEIYATDLGLSGEFVTAIAHDIREQVLMFRKSLAISGHSFDANDVIDEELREFFLPIVTTAARNIDQADWFMPKIHYLNDLDLEKMERDREKDIKRKKRLGKSRLKLGVPERDPQKTQRTMPGATEVNFGLPPAAIVTAAPSRRAAAQAASATIANLAAAENTDRQYPGYNPPPVVHYDRHATAQAAPAPTPAAAAATPAKKQKNILLHAPPLKDGIFTARAKLAGNTASTSLRPSAPGRSILSRARGEGEGPSSRGGGSGTPSKPHSNRAPTAKEINDAKIKEYAEGLHPCMVNGKWHCSVCGCPEEIAIGRRKGPLGEKTMCGDCGKYYHRHRRPNDQVEYNTDPEFHLAKRRGTDEARRLRRRTPASRLATETVSGADTPASIAPAETPLSDDDDDDEDDIPLASSRNTRHSQPPVNPIRIISPELSDPDSDKEVGAPTFKVRRRLDSASNSSLSPPPPIPTSLPEPEEAKVIERLQSNATPDQRAVSGAPSQPPDSTASSTVPLPATASPNGTRPVLTRKATAPHVLAPSGTPEWLKDQLDATLAAWPQDDFGAVQRPPQAGAGPDAPPEWRIKCYDCPGMLYKPGPGQTLENFVVHLRNRNHRNNVAKRVSGGVDGGAGDTS